MLRSAAIHTALGARPSIPGNVGLLFTGTTEWTDVAIKVVRAVPAEISASTKRVAANRMVGSSFCGHERLLIFAVATEPVALGHLGQASACKMAAPAAAFAQDAVRVAFLALEAYVGVVRGDRGRGTRRRLEAPTSSLGLGLHLLYTPSRHR